MARGCCDSIVRWLEGIEILLLDGRSERSPKGKVEAKRREPEGVATMDGLRSEQRVLGRKDGRKDGRIRSSPMGLDCGT